MIPGMIGIWVALAFTTAEIIRMIRSLDMENMISARNIKKLRRQKKWSQEKLAEACDIGRQSVTRYEDEERTLGIRGGIITKLCAALDTTADVILGRKEV